MWCNLRMCNSIKPLESDIISYLLYLKQLKKSYSVISCHKSVILETVKILNPNIVLNFNVLNRFMKGLNREIPPKPRYVFTWDVGKVLNVIAKWMPLQSLSLKLLTFKLVSLVALCTAARAQSLKALNINHLCIKEDVAIFDCGDQLKTTKPGQNFVIKLCSYVEHELCPVLTLKYYLKCTQSLRKDSQLFVSFKNYKAVSSSTLARWLKNVLLLAGIDIVKYKAHSYRGASSSAASRAGCKMSEILKTANWSSAKNFKVFYLRDVQNDHIENNYQNCVLNSR